MAVDNTRPLTLVDYPRIALILVEALFYGDKRTAKRWGITNRTVENYRYRLNDNEELSNLFNKMRLEFEANWAAKIPAAIMSGIDYLGEASKQTDYSPETIHAVNDAVRTLAEIGVMKEIMDARLAGYNSEDREEYRPLDSSSKTSP